MNFAKGLIACGLTPYSSVNIIGFNSPEWMITFYGSIFGNYLPVGIYTNNTPEGCKYISMHSDAELVVVEDVVQLNKYLKIWDELPKLYYILIYNEPVPENLPQNRKGQVFTFKEFLDIGKNFEPDRPEDSLSFRMQQQKPGNCCTLVYTSGTTGNPKGVMISHDNYTWTAQNWVNSFKFSTEKEKFMSYLPLSHVAAQIVDIVTALLIAAEVIFADPNVLQGSLIENLLEIRPSYFFGVPRIWEKIEEKLKCIDVESGLPQRKLSSSFSFKFLFFFYFKIQIIYWNMGRKCSFENNDMEFIR